MKAGASSEDIEQILLNSQWPEISFMEAAKELGFTRRSRVKAGDLNKMKEIKKINDKIEIKKEKMA